MNKLSLLLLICTALVSGIVPASAKRAAPAMVAPVVENGVRYEAPHDAMGFVVAIEVATNKELWRVRIYEVRVDPNLERDVQDVFITSLVAKDGSLLIANERGEKFALDIQTRNITRK
jgi:hypothetical protein